MTSSFPYISLFFSTMILGTFMTLSANQWIYIWMGLELNLLSFIPLITNSSMNRESEAAMKYFLAQAMGSGLLLLGAFSKTMFSFSPVNITSSLLIMFALLIKLGAAPCHFWFPVVMSNISWPLCMILATWQKIAPLMVLSYTNSLNQSSLVMFLAALGSLVGGVGGLNQTQLRTLLAYSSIGHLGWMISTPSLFTLMTYLSIYILMTISIMTILWKTSSKHWSFNLSMMKINPVITMTLIILLFSLAGLPPFIGFLPKWMILSSLNNMSFFWPLLLIIGSVIQLFYYISLMFSFYMKTINYSFSQKLETPSMNQILSLIASVTLGLSPLCLLI